MAMPERDGGAVAHGLDAAACLFRAFGDPSRLTILQHLALGEHRVVDLTAHLGLAQSTVSKHLACLRDCGLVESRSEGRASFFRLTHPDALVDVLAAAERVLVLTGDAVTLCPTTRTQPPHPRDRGIRDAHAPVPRSRGQAR